MIRIYIKEPWSDCIKITPMQFHYLNNVMRRPESFIIFNETRGEHLARLVKNDLIEVMDFLSEAKKLKPLKLAISVLKPKSMQMVLEKATELGVTEVFLLRTDHVTMDKSYCSIVHEKFTGSVIESSEQSERTDIPLIHKCMPFNQWFEMDDKKDFIAAIERSNDKGDQVTATGVLIGPEGGFSDIEKRKIIEKMETVSFGSLILRAETAAIYGLSILSHY